MSCLICIYFFLPSIVEWEQAPGPIPNERCVSLFLVFFFACSSKKMAYQQSRHIIRWRPIRWNPLRRNRRTKSDSGLNFFFSFVVVVVFCVFYWQKGSLVHVAEHAWIDCVCALGALLFSFFLSFFFFCIRLILLFPFCCCVFASHSFSSFECYWVCL